MTDNYALCEAELVAQLKNLPAYFLVKKAAGEKAEQWRISSDDTAPQRGGPFWAIYRPGSFVNDVHSRYEDNEWHIILSLYMRYGELKDVWSDYRNFRAAIIELRKTHPLHNHGVQDQTFAAIGEPGYLTDANDNYVGFIFQQIDVKIIQRLQVTMNL